MLLPAVLTISTFALVGWALWTPDLHRRLLLSRYSGVNDSVVEVAGIRLQVRDQGHPSAPPMVMLHGLGASLQTWEKWPTTALAFCC